MRALVVDPAATTAFSFVEVGEPTAASNQVLLDVHYVSLNHGDLNDARSGRVAPGAVLGSDVAGVVAEAPSEGNWPRVGTRLVGLTSGAFAERCVVDLDAVAEVPAELDLATTVALPVAGLAALRALRAGGVGPGARVLVTGASGGVGRFAVQLAAHAGAHVIASVGSAARGEGLVEAGADEVVVGLEAVNGLVDLVIDNVGGPLLVAAWDLLARGGNVQCVGWTSGQPAVFPPYSTIGPPKSLSSFLIEGDVASDLADLVERVFTGSLAVPVGWRSSWIRSRSPPRRSTDAR